MSGLLAPDEGEVPEIDQDARGLADDEDGIATPERIAEDDEPAGDREVPEDARHDAAADPLAGDPLDREPQEEARLPGEPDDDPRFGGHSSGNAGAATIVAEPLLVDTECMYGCPIGSLALELHEPDPAVREALAVNFEGWVAAVERCLTEAGERLPEEVERHALATFVLTTMEGGVMLARTYRDPAPFDAAVDHLRDYFARLEKDARERSSL